MRKIAITLAMVFLAAGCYWDNVVTFYPEAEACDTLDVSFALDVVPVLSNHCYGCHSNANAPDFGKGLSLENYVDVSAMSVRIIGAINHNPGFIPMPQGNEQLDSCQIRTIESWVNQGSLNN